MLPTDGLENTTAVTMFAFGKTESRQITVRTEKVQMLEGKAEDSKLQRQTKVDSMQQLQEKMPGLLKQLSSSPSDFSRLLVEMPYQLNVTTPSHDTNSNTNATIHPSEVVVDSPGLDSPGIKRHLVSVLDQKCFILCFVVDLTSPSPFGKDGFEVLQFLTMRSELMFPAIIFTKWELLSEMSTLPRWKKGNPKGLEARIKGLVNLLLDKLAEAGIRYTPFFADVDALSAFDGTCNPEAAEAQNNAKDGFQLFVRDLVQLGRSIANPTNQWRILQVQNQTTQQILNEIYKEEGVRLLAAEDMSQLKALGTTLKEQFQTDVEDYFKNIEWTEFGLADFKPCAPFNRDTCAINQIPDELKTVLNAYRDEKPDIWSKATAVQEIAERTLRKVQERIITDLSKYEADALAKFRAFLSNQKLNKDFRLGFSFLQYAIAVGMSGMSVFAGVFTGNAVFAAGLTATGLATSLGILTGGVGVVVIAGWLAKDEVGVWKWTDAHRTALKVVLEACQRNSQQLRDDVIKGFEEKLDDTLKNLEEHRINPNPAASQCNATRIHEMAGKGYTDVAKQLMEVLEGKKDRWLGRPSKLKEICEEVLKQRESA
ncbi:unnamed protein product [Durusdinium trenchii]|uniref:Uncharacterized protein n=2 Tax=Durusdinium trenchii TaxID=1381693 RepID=A0ABP0KWM7_9DINO